MSFAQQELIKEMPSLKRFAMKLRGNEQDADDLVQSTVLRALEKKHLFQEDTNLFRWTSKIMYNLFVTDYRRQTRFESKYDCEELIKNESVEAEQGSKAELRFVNESIETLSEEHRDILIMVCIKGMQYAEVAEELDIPIGTVRSRLSRAREQLRHAMEYARMDVELAKTATKH